MPNIEDLSTQQRTPYADALRSLAARDWQRLHVPAHQGAATNAPGIAELFGSEILAMDFPMSVVNIDQQSWQASAPGHASPLSQAQALAAEAWGARRTWFLTNGASGGNHIATMVARALGPTVIVQRSVHSSVIDGICHASLEPHFVQPAVHRGLGAALGLTAAQIEQALSDTPGAAAVVIVSPSYFGTVADVAAIARVAHAHSIPLIVDEAWGAHFGMHPGLPHNALRAGADLVVSSTHKGAGSLTQSAMLHLGDGPHAERLEPIVDRTVRSYQSTSCSAILLASLDLTRHHLVTRPDAIAQALESASRIRAGLSASSRFRDAEVDLRLSPDTVATDPLKVVVDVRAAGITGNEAQHLLIAEHGIYAELATPAALVIMIGASSPADADRLLNALENLPVLHQSPPATLALPDPGPRVLSVHEGFFAPTELVTAENAVGRVSADSLAAYPPGIPNVLPGEMLTADVVAYLRAMGAAPSGFVRGAVDPRLDQFRVVA